jgi:hypothetical protein
MLGFYPVLLTRGIKFPIIVVMTGLQEINLYARMGKYEGID